MQVVVGFFTSKDKTNSMVAARSSIRSQTPDASPPSNPNCKEIQILGIVNWGNITSKIQNYASTVDNTGGYGIATGFTVLYTIAYATYTTA